MADVFESSPPEYQTSLLRTLQQAKKLHRQGQLAAAAELYSAVLSDRPHDFDALHMLGVLKHQQGRSHEGVELIASALRQNSHSAPAWSNYSVALRALRRHEEALSSCDKALALAPRSAEALYNRGNILQSLRRFDDALESYDKALAIKPDYVEAHNNRAGTLLELKRGSEALQSFDLALALAPHDPYAFTGAADAALAVCDWTRAEEIGRQMAERGAETINPFTLLGYCEDPALQLKAATRRIHELVPILPEPLWRGTLWQNDRIKIAYFSTGFRRHPTAYLMAQLFELHDRRRFEIIGISSGRDDHSDMRARLVAGFDQFHDVQMRGDRDVAKLINNLAVDIVVDLNGFIQGCRPAILAYRPAPIQVNYLGYPGTMGAEFIDYVIADRYVLPFEDQAYYTEKIVHLPHSYQANDFTRRIAAHTPTRLQAGLPAEGFVFCCFNNSYKITAPVFDVWMRLLAAVENSVLWLLRDNAGARTNLRNEAKARGIDPARLVFSNRINSDEHLARHRLADLFLDTLPINAHTTASDALWAGLPMLTCIGKSFAGRVGASLLCAAGLPELVAESLEEYEALALGFALDPELLADVRVRLARNRLTFPLFDSKRFARHIEAAYLTMWETWQRGESPASFTVAPTDGS